MQQECNALGYACTVEGQNQLWLYGTFMETMEAKRVNSNVNKQNTKEKKTKLERNQEDKISA